VRQESAGALKKAGEIILLTKPSAEGSVIWRFAVLQAGAVTPLKSPPSICAEGTNAMEVLGADRLVVLCSPAKRNSLFLLIGPPSVPPN